MKEEIVNNNDSVELRYHATKFVIAMVLILCLGIVVALAAPHLFHDPAAKDGERSIFEAIFHELGHAMIVAAILGLTVDLFAKKRHDIMAESISRRINTDVIGAIYGQQFPASIREEVRRNFLEQRIHREDLNITYTFKALPGYPDRLLVQEKSSYRFVNTTDQAVPFTLRAYVECPIEEQLRTHCKLLEASINDEELGGDDLAGAFGQGGMEFQWSQQVMIPAHGSVRFSSGCQTIKYMRDVESWSSLYPSDGITLNVSLEVDLEVFAKCAGNSGNLRPEIDNRHFKRWKLENGVFPGQAVTFWWNPPHESRDAAVAMLTNG
jgi:hypothetical protein